MTIYYPTTGTQTQSVAILTNVQQIHPTIICPITAVLTTSAAYISLSSDFTTITVDSSQITLTDIRTHTFNLQVDSSLYSATVTQANYSFNVIVLCQISSLSITSSPSNILFAPLQSALTTSPLTVVSSYDCQLLLTYTLTNVVLTGNLIA